MTPKNHLILIARKKTLLPDRYETGIVYPGILIKTEEYTGLYFPGDYVYEHTIGSKVNPESEIVVIHQATSNTIYYLVISEKGGFVEDLRVDRSLLSYVNPTYRYRWLVSTKDLRFKPQFTF